MRCCNRAAAAAGAALALVSACRPTTPLLPPTTPVPASTARPAPGSPAPGSPAPGSPAPGTPAPIPPARATPTRARTVVNDDAPPLAREFRGVWVASVANIDWPSKRTLSTAEQQAELIALLDRAAALKLNAVLFQIRPAADALYASKIEPWSEYLTGAQGRAPVPFWDPLEFAIKEAHARNLELHAWFNPYRARHTDARSPLSSTHIARTNPSLVKPYAGYLWMDPGEPAVRARTLRVVLDVVQRYDVDGVHIDDYFYPYPENDRRGRAIPFPDERSWKRYVREGGTLVRADWRRRNVDLLVQALDEGVHKAKPWVRFGISPFGIWRPGYPTQVRGLDAYEKLYADARKWLREGWVDYFTPQLYWPTTKREQAYPALLDWWIGENVMGRHMWPGNFTSRAGGVGSGAFSVGELVEQIRVTRLQNGATGNVHFSMKSFLTNQAGMNDTLLVGPYATPALVPATPWLKAAAPPLPIARLTETTTGTRLLLRTTGTAVPWQYAIRMRTDTAWITMLVSGSTTSWAIPKGTSPTLLSVVSLNRVGTESSPVSITLSSRTGAAGTPSTPARGRYDAP
ncbi:family 10 glycosylhydrolase [Gemmatimonas sp.]|uniref:glycoside hydrolase family 10 protein n=1 Tax=Gemmatimonas sp. TaxID=1962908 RepID=UPI0035623758